MRLQELQEQSSTIPERVFAFWRQKKGPNNIPGVELAYVDPMESKFATMLQNAEADQEEKRIANLIQSRNAYRKNKQKFFTPSIDWWISKEKFEDGSEGVGGVTKGNILKKYPTLTVVDSQDEAIAAAKKAGIV